MAIDRRGFLAGCGATLLGARTSAAAPTGETFFCARAAGQDRHQVVAFDGGGDILLECALPARCHAIAVRPDGGQCVVVARRPGAFALAIDTSRRTVLQQIEPTARRTFAGHAVYSTDGRHLLLTEDDAEREQGFLTVRDVEDGYRTLLSLPTGGIGPHELLWTADGRTVAVANGGILVSPETGRAALNLDSMQPSLVLVDVAAGALLRLVTLPAELHKLSIRHLAVLAGGRLAFGMQYQGSLEDDVPLVGILEPDGSVRFLDMPSEIGARLQGYIGSVAADAGGRFLAASAPRGNCVLLWDGATGDCLGTVEIADGCGLSRTAAAGEFLLTGGTGVVERVACKGGLRSRRVESTTLMDGQWDNHVSYWQR